MAHRSSLRRAVRLFARFVGRRALVFGFCITVPLAVLQTLQIRKFRDAVRQSDSSVSQTLPAPDAGPDQTVKVDPKPDPQNLAVDYEFVSLAPGRNVLLLGGRAYMVGDRTPFGRLQVVGSDHSVFLSRGELVIVKPKLDRFLEGRPQTSSREKSSEKVTDIKSE